jgi:hypothetical protein
MKGSPTTREAAILARAKTASKDRLECRRSRNRTHLVFLQFGFVFENVSIRPNPFKR